MTGIRLRALALALAVALSGAGCVLATTSGASLRAACDICTPETMGGSGFALPHRGVVIYQGTVKIFDFERRTFSFIETDPPLMRPRAARVVARRDMALSNADYVWAARMAENAWAPSPAKAPPACAGKETKGDGRLPALVVLIDQGKFFAHTECGPEDAAGQLSELTARADRIVAQRYPEVTPK